VGPEVTGTAQAALPADAGAVLMAAFDSMRTSAESVRFWLSVTVTRSVIEPEAGAMTVAEEVSVPTMAGGLVSGATTLQAKVATVLPQAAALPDALSVTFWPAATLPGKDTAAIGRSAASSELAAFAMPAPQVLVVHRHCTSWKS
jgi:hypothetical protein